MIKKNSILIVSFYYPPYPKVGSRRWVKFAKYLNRKGRKIRILAAQMDVDCFSPWDEDAKETEHLLTRIHFNYKVPYYKRLLPSNFSSKIKWHLSLIYDRLNRFLIKGNPSDKSQQYADKFVQEIRKIIKDSNINTLIFTANPFHLAYHISALKKEYPDLKFVFDLRDYWSERNKSLSSKIYAYEKKLERETIMHADIILTPAEKIAASLKNNYPSKERVVHVIPHSFDEDDYEFKEPIITSSSQKKMFLYAGTLYNNMEKNIDVICELMKADHSVFLNIYSSEIKYDSIFKKNGLESRVSYFKQIRLKELIKLIQEASGWIYMFDNTTDDCDFFTTKFFDYMPAKKPVIYIGKEGIASQYIVKNKIGLHLSPDTIGQFTTNLSALTQSVKNFDFDQYSFNNITDRLITILEN